MWLDEKLKHKGKLSWVEWLGSGGAHVVTLALLFASVMAEGSCDTVSGGEEWVKLLKVEKLHLNSCMITFLDLSDPKSTLTTNCGNAC